MADEFVDFYEALNLPVEADRKEVRKRINEVYLEAQRNLDHRNFQTRVKHQEMFEVVLPRARYILLDEGRRDEYDLLVKSFRAASAPAPVAAPQVAPAPVPQEKSFGKGDTSGFRLEAVEEEPAGKAPPIDALPGATFDPAQMAAQREASWAKWKQGLESAIVREESNTKPAESAPVRTAPATPAQPRATVQPIQESTQAQVSPRPQASSISFDFGQNSSVVPITEDDEETAKKKAHELEKQKAERKRVITQEILDSVSLKGTIIGALGAAIPLGALLIFVVGHFYPRDSAPQLPVPSIVVWVVGLLIVCGGAFVAATQLSRIMRDKESMKLSMLSLEDLLRQVGRTY